MRFQIKLFGIQTCYYTTKFSICALTENGETISVITDAIYNLFNDQHSRLQIDTTCKNIYGADNDQGESHIIYLVYEHLQGPFYVHFDPELVPNHRNNHINLMSNVVVIMHVSMSFQNHHCKRED